MDRVGVPAIRIAPVQSPNVDAARQKDTVWRGLGFFAKVLVGPDTFDLHVHLTLEP